MYLPISKGLIRKLPSNQSTVIDDFEYQSTFAALDELRLGNVKPFFKEQCLQVTEIIFVIA